MTAQLLVVSAGGRRVGVALEQVTEIVDRGTVLALPRLPPAITGVIAFRGAAVPLIDLWSAGPWPAVSPASRRQIVVATDGMRPLAILVDEVEGIIDSADAGDAELLDVCGLFERIS